MRIIEKLIKNYKNANLCFDNIKDFDYTKLDEDKFYDYINTYLNKTMIDNKVQNNFGGKLVLKAVEDMCLADGKVYPVFKSELNIGIYGNLHKVNVNICPFGCYKIDEGFVCADTFKKNITKAVVDFMTKEFGEKYTEKVKDYRKAVKDKKLKKAKQNFDLQLIQAEEEYVNG